jgi:hypothetical protein
VRSSRTQGSRSHVANRAVFFVGGSSVNAIQRLTHAGAAVKQGIKPAIGPPTAKQATPFDKPDAAKTRLFRKAKMLLAIC